MVRPDCGVATEEVRQPALLRRGHGDVPETVLHGNVVQLVRAGLLDERMCAQLALRRLRVRVGSVGSLWGSCRVSSGNALAFLNPAARVWFVWRRLLWHA